MGTDIHGVVQVRENGVWRIVPAEPPTDPRKLEYWEATDLWGGRDYRIFTLLADVRNYEYEVKPISQPRGVPEGFVLEKERCLPGTDLWMGDHSYSWVTLDELTDRSGSEDSSFWPWVDSVLAPLGKQYGPENVRLVFGFDS